MKKQKINFEEELRKFKEKYGPRQRKSLNSDWGMIDFAKYILRKCGK